MAIQMNVSGLRRNLKNIAHNYTDAQVKVREATSNDPWGPSSTLMAEVADLTYNVVAFSEIMQMVWKRLNDHGRNWRHVYKALVLLEYLIKTGSDKVADQCKENIYTIQTLKDFQYLEENKDMGINVREKAKSLVSLLKDDERLRNERVRALKAKERFSQTVSGIGSDSDITSPTSPSYSDAYATSRTERDSYHAAERPVANLDLENARPQTIGEEELQLQLALAMSKEEADQEEAKRKSDDVRLQMALSQSESDYRGNHLADSERTGMNDLLDINFNPSGMAASSSMSALPSQSSAANLDPWGIPIGSAVSSGSVSPQNPGLPHPKTSLLDVFQDFDGPDRSGEHTPSADADSTVDTADTWGLPMSKRDTSTPKTDPWGLRIANQNSHSVKQNDPWKSPSSAPSSRVTSPPASHDPWAPVSTKAEVPIAADPWSPVPVVQSHHVNDPWKSVVTSKEENEDPFAPLPLSHEDEFSAILHRDNTRGLDLPSQNGFSQSTRPKSKSPNTFLGENSNLVNLDNLVSVRPTPIGMVGTSSPSYQTMSSLNVNCSFGMPFDAGPKSVSNRSPVMSHYSPFVTPSRPAESSFVSGVNPFNGSMAPNPFQAQQTPKPSLNQMRTLGGPSASPWRPVPMRDDDPFQI